MQRDDDQPRDDLDAFRGIVVGLLLSTLLGAIAWALVVGYIFLRT
jgi:hypothetical protein